MSLFKKTVFIITMLFILILGSWFTIVWYHFIYMPICTNWERQEAATVKIPPGVGLRYLAYHLFQGGFIKHPKLFILLAQFTKDTPLLKLGEYQITRNLTAQKLLDNIVAGKVKQGSVTFIEGWTFRQVKEALTAESHIVHTINELSDQQIMAKLGDTQGHPEGLFFPDTYFFNWGESDFQILHQAYDRMKIILNKAWYSRSKNLPYKNSYQALIVASLIEKEAALSKERPKIAGVILRRLKKEYLYK